MDWNRFPNFSEDEFRCHCGCGDAAMDEEFILLLQAVRDKVGAIIISSGYRCPDHNERVSSSGRAGPHTTGMAADISAAGGDALLIMREAMLCGVERIGVNQKGSARFIHLDKSTTHTSPALWSY